MLSICSPCVTPQSLQKTSLLSSTPSLSSSLSLWLSQQIQIGCPCGKSNHDVSYHLSSSYPSHNRTYDVKTDKLSQNHNYKDTNITKVRLKTLCTTFSDCCYFLTMYQIFLIQISLNPSLYRGQIFPLRQFFCYSSKAIGARSLKLCDFYC